MTNKMIQKLERDLVAQRQRSHDRTLTLTERTDCVKKINVLERALLKTKVYVDVSDKMIK